MKSFAKLPAEDLKKLVDLVYAQRDPDAVPPEERPGGDLLSELECTLCHDFEDWSGVEGPALFKYGTAEWIAQVIDDAESDVFYGKPNEMPAFATRLPKADRDALVAFLLSLEARAAPNEWPFIDDPGPIPTPRTSTTAGKQ
jgi:mono/diheme cytochrome c family protein